jgi:hypothetical protein
MPQETEFIFYLTDQDRIRVGFTTDGGTPVALLVQLECLIDARWLVCRRYDNRHGYLHVHTVPWDESRDRRVPVEAGDLRRAIRRLTDELRATWPASRARMEADLGTRPDEP